MAKSKYWDGTNLEKIPAQYRIAFGERSNGKTYWNLRRHLKKYIDHGWQMAYVRRWPDDIKARKMQQVFDALCRNGEIAKLSGGKWNGVKYKYGKFYLIATDGEGTVVEDETPFCFVFAISAMEHDKSIAYPGIRIIMFDEFISRQAYIPDEFALFMNLLSTLIRERDDVEIWMLGNTVSKECPYFREMGLKHVFNQLPGTIDTYAYRKNGQELLIAVEYTKNIASKKSDKYFIFDNPKMEMITGGAWELAIYPHLFEKYKPNQVMFMFFILYRDNILQCEMVEGRRGIFIFVHLKTTPLKDNDDDIIYCPEPSANRNYRLNIMRPDYPVERKISQLIVSEKVCFQDNEIGEIFNDYMKWCSTHQVIKK